MRMENDFKNNDVLFSLVNSKCEGQSRDMHVKQRSHNIATHTYVHAILKTGISKNVKLTN